MRVFDFTLLSGYEFSGVDVAQGFRARLFAKNNVNAKFIFTELPTIRDMELYGSQKIKRGQIMSAHLFMTGRLDMSLSVKKEALLENEKENYEYDNIDEDGKVIRLYNSGEKCYDYRCFRQNRQYCFKRCAGFSGIKYFYHGKTRTAVPVTRAGYAVYGYSV